MPTWPRHAPAAGDRSCPSYAAMMNRIGCERGWSAKTRGQSEAGRSPRGALLVGSLEEVAKKILFKRNASRAELAAYASSVVHEGHLSVPRAILARLNVGVRYVRSVLCDEDSVAELGDDACRSGAAARHCPCHPEPRAESINGSSVRQGRPTG